MKPPAKQAGNEKCPLNIKLPTRLQKTFRLAEIIIKQFIKVKQACLNCYCDVMLRISVEIENQFNAFIGKIIFDVVNGI